MSSDDIFRKIEEEEVWSLYKNQRIFAEDYAPKTMDEVKDRKKEKEEIVKCVRKTAKGVKSELYVFGMPGVGKTYTIRAVLNDCMKRWEKTFQYVWLNCKNVTPLTGPQIMNEICIQLGAPFKSRGRGRPEREIAERVIEKHKQTPLLIVFDEADAIAKVKGLDRILYTFTDHGISQIPLSNVDDWVDNVDIRIKSRMQNNSITFGSYSKDDLKEILWFLANEGLKKGSINDKVLAKIAQYTIDTFMGDVRKAKVLIDNSADAAMKERAKVITEKHLEAAIPTIEPTRLANMLRRLSPPVQCALGAFVNQRIHSDRDHGKKQLATTANILFFYKKITELNGLKPIKSTAMLKEYLKRLELMGILEPPQLVSYKKTRGKTNIYFSLRSIEELGKALEELKLIGCGDGYQVSFGFFSSKRVLGLSEKEEKWNEQALKKLEEINRKKGISKNLRPSLKGFLAEG